MSMTDDPTGFRRGNPSNRQGQQPQYSDSARQQRYDPRVQRPGPGQLSPQDGYVRGPAPASDVPRRPQGAPEAGRPSPYSSYRQPQPAPIPLDNTRYNADQLGGWDQQPIADYRRATPPSQLNQPIEPRGNYSQAQPDYQDRRYYEQEAAPAADDGNPLFDQDRSYHQGSDIFHLQNDPEPVYQGRGTGSRGGDYDFSQGAGRESFAAQQAGAGANFYPSSSNVTPLQSTPQELHDRFFPDEDGSQDFQQHYGRQGQVGPENAQSYNYDQYDQGHRQSGYGQAPDGPLAEDWDDYGQDRHPPQGLGPQPQERRLPEDDLDADFFSDEDDFDPEHAVAQPQKSGRKKLMAAVLVGAVVLGGGLAAFYKFTTGSQSAAYTEPPTLQADNSDVKQLPQDPGGREFPNQTKKIYERIAMDGDNSPAGVQTNEMTTPPGGAPSGSIDQRIEDALRKAREGGDSSAAPSSDQQGNFDEPRRVATTIYRPDGSVVDQSGGGAAVANDPAPASAPQIATTVQTQRPRPQPAPRPSAPSITSSAAAQPAPQQNVAAVAPAAAPASGGSGYYLQLKSSNDQQKALAELANIQQKYASVLGNYRLDTKSIDLGEKGVWFRTRVGPLESKEAANDLCQKLKSAGFTGLTNCLIRAEQ